MKTWKRWIDKILALFSKTRLSDEELIAYGRQLEREETQKRTYVWIDPTVRQRGYEQSAWNVPPERTTGPVQGIRRRATMRTFQEHPGILMQHHKEMQKRAQTVKLDPETVILPVVQQPRKPRLHRLYAEPDSTFNAL